MAHPSSPAVLFFLFCNAVSMSGSMQCLNVLLIDCHPDSPSAASAATNLVRCLIAAGAVALVEPLLESVDRGWTSMIISVVLFFGSLL
jgi:hypothetical protein